MSSTINSLAIILSVISLIASLASIVLVLAMRFSTHKIEWKPLVTEELKEEDKFKEEEEDDIELLTKAIDLSNEAREKKKKKITDPLDEILETNNF